MVKRWRTWDNAKQGLLWGGLLGAAMTATNFDVFFSTYYNFGLWIGVILGRALFAGLIVAAISGLRNLIVGAKTP